MELLSRQSKCCINRKILISCDILRKDQLKILVLRSTVVDFDVVNTWLEGITFTFIKSDIAIPFILAQFLVTCIMSFFVSFN